MVARAVGLATTGASLPPVASHASVAASAYHPPTGSSEYRGFGQPLPQPPRGVRHAVFFFTTKRNFY